MPIELVCSCGHKGKVPDNYAGQKVKCKQCQGFLTVPGNIEDIASQLLTDTGEILIDTGEIRISAVNGTASQREDGKGQSCPACGSKSFKAEYAISDFVRCQGCGCAFQKVESV